MGAAEALARVRLHYHANLLEVNNVLNQLGIRNDDKAEEVAKHHVMTIINDCLPRIYGQKAVDDMMDARKEAIND